MILGHVVCVFTVFFECTEDGPSILFRTCILTYAVSFLKILENRLESSTSLGVVFGFLDHLHTSCFRTVSFKMTCTTREAFFYTINSKFCIFFFARVFFVYNGLKLFPDCFSKLPPNVQKSGRLLGYEHEVKLWLSFFLQIKTRKNLICCV
jgi:hypothetical protein